MHELLMENQLMHFSLACTCSLVWIMLVQAYYGDVLQCIRLFVLLTKLMIFNAYL